MYLFKDYIIFRMLIFVMKFYFLVYNGYFDNRVIFFFDDLMVLKKVCFYKYFFW